MKRALLIATGTVGGLGAVLSITPPQIGTSNALMPEVATSGSTTSSSPSSSASASPSAATNKSNTSVSSKSNANQNTKSTVTKTPKAKPTSVAGSFTGDAVDVGYGIVQVKITVSDGKITDAVAVQAPSGRSQRFSDMAVPNLRSQTLQVQSAAINGVSGASYTSYGWYQSLISALNKAGIATGV